MCLIPEWPPTCRPSLHHPVVVAIARSSPQPTDIVQPLVPMVCPHMVVKHFSQTELVGPANDQRFTRMQKKIFLVSRCAWTLYNFRAGLMQALRQRGHTVVAGGAAGDGFEPKIEALGVPFVPLPVDKKGVNPRADVALFWALYRWYRRERPDVVHHFTIKPVIYGSVAARLARVPRIVNTVTGLGYVFMEDHIAWLR